MHFLEVAAAIASITMLLSQSKLFAPVRNRLPEWVPIHCPVCLSFWVAAPVLYNGTVAYFATVTCSNACMLIIAKLYLAIDDMDFEPE